MIDAEEMAETEESSIDTTAALAALLLLLWRMQKRMWRPAKEDLIRRLQGTGLGFSDYNLIVRSWSDAWRQRYSAEERQNLLKIEPGLDRIRRVIASQVTAQLKDAGYALPDDFAPIAVERKIRQLSSAATQTVTTQANATLELASQTIQQAAIAELPPAKVIEIVKQIEAPKRRVQMSARDATGTLLAITQRTFFKAAGVEKAIWRTKRDNRVRDTHRAREGKIYDIDKGLGGIQAGQEPGCRCIAEPIPRSEE